MSETTSEQEPRKRIRAKGMFVTYVHGDPVSMVNDEVHEVPAYRADELVAAGLAEAVADDHPLTEPPKQPVEEPGANGPVSQAKVEPDPSKVKADDSSGPQAVTSAKVETEPDEERAAKKAAAKKVASQRPAAKKAAAKKVASQRPAAKKATAHRS